MTGSLGGVTGLTETLNLFLFSSHAAGQLCRLQPHRRVSVHLLWSGKTRARQRRLGWRATQGHFLFLPLPRLPPGWTCVDVGQEEAE